jgi:sirohydrochlorin cobaltochelatase
MVLKPFPPGKGVICMARALKGGIHKLKRAMLVVSFGTSCLDILEKTIAAVENEINEKYDSFEVRRAFTSSMIIKKLAKAGTHVDSVEIALKKLVAEKFEEVYIVPTHVIAGSEYEKIVSQANIFKTAFETLKIGKPLIYTTGDMERIVSIITKSIVLENGSALVLVGHGTKHCMNTVYGAIDYMFKEKGFENIFVGTVEAYPSNENVVKLVKKAGYNRAVIAPLMLVAGEHANNDMAGDGASWKNKFVKNGIKTEVMLKGLGEYEEIREMYISHIGECFGIWN